MFIEYLKNENNYIFKGVKNFLKLNSHNKIAIVTSCNKKAANYILESTGLIKYIDIIITSEDCINHKPHPEPYLKAINYFNCDIKNVYIFEDSYSGYCSAKRTNVENIALIINSNTSKNINDIEQFKYNNYNELKLENIDTYYKNRKYINISNFDKQILEIIKNKLAVKSIYKNNINIKSGYICDINIYNIIYNNNNKDSIILKISNLDNELSNTALKLNMYSNENYFYTNLSQYIKNIPEFYGSFKYNNKDAIILEDLNKFKGEFNINLNNNINILLSVIYNIFKIHSLYYFKSEENISLNFKYLKSESNYLL